jgi:hypothetical protein
MRWELTGIVGKSDFIVLSLAPWLVIPVGQSSGFPYSLLPMVCSPCCFIFAAFLGQGVAAGPGIGVAAAIKVMFAVGQHRALAAAMVVVVGVLGMTSA